jgi:E3 ubiquitin-protein ligase HUWE1
MGKITKKPQEKHNASLVRFSSFLIPTTSTNMLQSPAVLDLVQKVSDASLAELPAIFESWDRRWPYPRGDLMNWVVPLDRFDDILKSFNRRYGLDQGPQTSPFGVAVLVEGTPGSNEQQMKERFGEDGDRVLVESILEFSRLLVEKCANRNTFSSTDRLNDLLNTTSLTLLHRTLRLTVFLAQRYSERAASLPAPSIKFYDFDQDRLRCLASPVTQNLSQQKRTPSSPVKSTKSKPGQSSRPRRASSVTNPNDFRSLCRDSPTKDGSKPTQADRDWINWAHVKVTWSSETTAKAVDDSDTPAVQSPAASAPSTPTPLRRQTSASAKSPQVGDTPQIASTVENAARSIEYSPIDLGKITIEEALMKCPADMPQQARYELLHKLRVAYGLITSPSTRRDVLAIRILSIDVVGSIFTDEELQRHILGKDQTAQKPQELIQQLVNLIQDPKKGQSAVDLYMQTLGMETISVLARHKPFGQDIAAALGASSANGLLLRLTQRALDDITKDGDATDTFDGDEWREAVFSLPPHVIETAGGHGRVSEPVFSATFVGTYVTGLRHMTVKAMRVHLRILDFVKSFFHHFKDGIQVLLQTEAFDIVCNLTRNITEDAWQQYQAGGGLPTQYKTRLTDYEIPYIHRQVLRSIIDMINDITGHQGANADRASRSLVDSQSLLTAFKLIMDKLEAFGTHTWSEVVKAICGFLNNEPTCFTVIAEAGIIKSFLQTVTKRDGPLPESEAKQKLSSISRQNGPGIPASIEAIVNASQLFEAICLTSAGFDLFKTSGALEKFFELFESPAHVKLMKDQTNMRTLGSTFDELVRHHPNLRPTVMSSVIVMIARVRHIARAMAGDYGAGPKMWLEHGKDGTLTVAGGDQALRQEIVPPIRPGASGTKEIALPDEKILVIEEGQYGGLRCEQPQNEDSHGLTASDYMRPAVGFLAHLFRTQSLCSYFLEQKAADIVLDFITISSVPVAEYSFGMHGHMEELANVVHMMAELKPGVILPALVDRALFICKEMDVFVHANRGRDQSYFGPLIQQAAEHGQSPTMDITSPVEQQGTYLVRCMMAIYCLAQVIGEVFSTPMYNARSPGAFLFGAVNLADLLGELCSALGNVSASCVREALAIQRNVPESWIKATKPESFSMGDDEVDQILRIWDSSNASTSDEETPELISARATAAFKNVQTLRYLTLETPAAVAELLGSIGHGIAGGRKRADTFSRQKSIVVAEAIAKALLDQLQPSFLAPGRPDSLDKEARFQYLVVCLTNMRASLHDDLQGAGNGEFCQSYVVYRLKEMGGLRRLRDIGAEFFAELEQCKVESWTFAANTGLKTCLDIFDIFTAAKTVVSAPQSNHMKSTDPNKGNWFVPAQALLEFRMEVLPLVREIWTSDYADQASRDVIQKLVSILKHTLRGDSEEDAIKTVANYPKVAASLPRAFVYDNERIRELKRDGYDEDLAREALYRTNTTQQSHQTNAAREYCEAMVAGPRRRRLPPPSMSEASATSHETPSEASPAGANSQLPVGPIEDALAQIMNNASDDSEMEGVTSTSNNDAARPPTSGSSAMDLSNILNHSDEPAANAPVAADKNQALVAVENIDAERALIREDLAERCNNVLNSHSDMVFDLSDLISSATQKLSQEEIKIFWESTSALLVNSLLSMQADDEITDAEGKKIAAAAHLIALLVNDKEVFKIALEVFQENFESMLSFLKLNSNVARKSEDAYPWVGPILLLLEQMLSQDSEPAEVRWEYPRDLESEIQKAVLVQTSTVSLEQKKELFLALLDCLPRVGKDRAMALSITRVLVMLTRKREIATMLAEKRNLQRLFLMVKQLGSSGSKAFLSSFMLVLRHIIEDEETLKQIMRSEILTSLTGRNAPPSRTLDINAYTRELAHLVIRSPETFVEVSNEMLKLGSWQPHSPGSQLLLKDPPKSAEDQPDVSREGETEQDPANEAAASVEDNTDQQGDSKGKATDVKPPVVENPDGVIHFLLSELLSYKDVEDKDVPAPARNETDATEALLDTPVAPTVVPESTASSGDESSVLQTHTSKAERPRFKQEEHPIFIYRCFLLQCLVELLHSYNRTKVEFINFSRKADPMAVTPSKPRSGVLNYVLGGLVASGYIDKDDQSIHCKKRLAVSDWAIKVVVALCSKTGEKGRSAPAQRYSLIQVDDKDDEPELTFVRRFVLEHAIRAFKDATSSSESLQHKYSKLLCLSDMFNRLLSKPTSSDGGAAGSNNNSYKVLGRMMFEKNLISVLTGSLAEIDLSQQGAKRVIKFILRPLQELTTLATALSLSSPEVITSVLGSTSDDDISSASSVSEVEDEREETPDLYRNSALGLLDPNRSHGSDSDSDDEEEDEEMYDDEEYPDEMEYDDMPAAPEDDEAVSDDDEEADLDGPIEGMPGDVPMELEFVVNDGGMDVDDDTQDDSDSDDSESEDSEEDLEADFEIGEDADEINGDNENDSLNGGEDNEGEWEDEGDDDVEEDEDGDDGDDDRIEIDMDGNLIGGGDEAPALQDDLNNLLRVLNGQDEDGEHAGHTHIVMHPGARDDDDREEGEDADGAEDDEDMDDNDALGHDHFDDFMEGDVEDDFYDDQWVLEEPSTRPSRGLGRRNFGGRSIFRPPPPPFFQTGFREATDGLMDGLPPFYRTTGNRRAGRQDQDDGTNPLLQRPATDPQPTADRARDIHRLGIAHGTRAEDDDSEALNSFADLMPGPVREAFRTVMQAEGSQTRGHGQILDLIANSIHRGGPAAFIQGGHPVSINVNVPAVRPPYRLGATLGNSRMREDLPRAVNFSPATTLTRWKEELSIIFNNQYVDKVQRVQILLMSLLAPAAQQEEKERRRKREEEVKAREEEEKRQAEAAQLRKEREEQEAAARAEEERRLAAEAEAAAANAAAQAESQPPHTDAHEGEPMEGVQTAEDSAPGQEEPDQAESSEPAQERVFTTIRGRQLDITGLAIDREYLEALPEELREEVIMQQYATRREEAQQQSTPSGPAGGSGGNAAADAAGIDPEYLNDFLNALPEEVREEIRQSEANAQLQREREAARREATAAAGRPAQAEDMNNDDFLATLDPALRREILGEQSNDILAQLNPRFAAEGREHARRIFHYSGLPIGRQAEVGRPDRDGQRDNKRQVVQLVDKAGVATLLRLMFLPQGGSLRSNLGHILRNVCGNRVTRFEVINMLLVILKEGSTDVTAVEKSLASLSLRARATGAQKTPQPLKRTLSMQPSAGLSEDVTPLVVVQQCLSALKQLSQHGFHVRTLFLREVDVSSSSKSKKGKDKESKITKYPINDLITLLDRELIVKSAPSLQSLAELLATVTSPLVVLMRKEKEQQKPEEKKAEEPEVSTESEQPAAGDQARPEDTDMVEGTEPVVREEDEAFAVAGREGGGSPPKDDGAEAVKAEELKAKKTFEPPVIPARNLQLIVDIFVAPECGNDTFHATLDTMSSIASIPGTSEIFGEQLIGHVKTLSQSLTTSLDELLPQLREAQSSTELHGIASSHFSHSGSDQVKLLHVLKALDYLSGPVKDGESNKAAVKSILTASYEELSLGPLWSKLSESLAVMGEKDNVIAFATILLPLIESLMVVCKNTSLKEAPISQQLREEGPTTPVVEDLNDLEKLFFEFTTQHRKILNDIIRQSPKLMQGNGSFSLLAKNPKVLDFDNKRAFFTKQIHSRLHQQRHVQPPLQLNVRREQVFQDSYKALYFKSADEMKYGKLNIRFNGEEGVDAGGVTREWFQVLARGIFNPDWALWQPVASDKTTFHPNPLSWINGEHLVYFKFIGRIIGKALHESRVLDCHFSRAVYKRMLGKQPNLKDLESMDLDYYKSLVWILENDITEVLTEDFSVIEEQFGEEKVVDLIPDGRNVPVTEDNKRDYVQKLVEYRLTGSVSEQLDHFIRGFHDIIPAELVAIFDEQELELLISGLPEIDVDDWKANTDYHNYNVNSPQVTWFWRIVRAMSNEERAKLLQFITGTSKVPLNGFKDLEGMQGTTRFSSKFLFCPANEKLLMKLQSTVSPTFIAYLPVIPVSISSIFPPTTTKSLSRRTS